MVKLFKEGLLPAMELQMFDRLGGNWQFITLDCWYNEDRYYDEECCSPCFNFSFILFNLILVNLDVFPREKKYHV